MIKNGGNEYLTMYPKLRRWMNQCVACQRQGYKPEMPDDIYPGVAARNLRRFFEPLELDDNGFCEQCREAEVERLRTDHDALAAQLRELLT